MNPRGGSETRTKAMAVGMDKEAALHRHFRGGTEPERGEREKLRKILRLLAWVCRTLFLILSGIFLVLLPHLPESKGL